MKYGIIGFGNMGTALCEGLIKKNIKPVVVEKHLPRREIAEKEYNLVVMEADEAAKTADIIVLAVKPQEVAALYPLIGKHTEGKGIVSMMAGVSIDAMAKALNTKNVIRFMQNLAASVAASPVAVSCHPDCGEKYSKEALSIAEAIGTPYEIPEKLMAAFTGLSGSGIAYVFEFINALAMGGVEAGIKYPDSLNIALDTVEGAVNILRAQKIHPSELVSRVASPAGTTIEGIRTLEDGAFTAIVMEAVNAAAQRALELELE
ncbi:MAG: pyrroline-5-carboxylate reductase [Spirochaetales bacterium]|nr:pyrroline-5-carboxylate reductase [Spirochaetales bacterium]